MIEEEFKCTECGIILKDKHSQSVGQCLSCFNQMMMDDDEDNKEPDFYECFCCGHSQTKKPSGFGCPKCTAQMEEGYF